MDMVMSEIKFYFYYYSNWVAYIWYVIRKSPHCVWAYRGLVGYVIEGGVVLVVGYVWSDSVWVSG